MGRSPTQTKVSSEVSQTVQVRYLCHVMRQAESSRDTIQRRKNSCLRDAFVFLLWHTSRHQPIAVIGGRCRSRADNLQPETGEDGVERTHLNGTTNRIARSCLHCLNCFFLLFSHAARYIDDRWRWWWYRSYATVAQPHKCWTNRNRKLNFRQVPICRSRDTAHVQSDLGLYYKAVAYTVTVVTRHARAFFNRGSLAIVPPPQADKKCQNRLQAYNICL